MRRDAVPEAIPTTSDGSQARSGEAPDASDEEDYVKEGAYKEPEGPQDRPAMGLDMLMSTLKVFVKKHQNLMIWLTGAIAFIVGWWALAVIVDKPYLPNPYEVLDALWRSFTTSSFRDPKLMPTHIAASLTRVAWGFVIALFLAAPLGFLAGYSKRVETFISPTVELLRPIPPIAWLPFAIVFFTARDFPASAVFIIFLGIFFPILINTVDGVKGIDKLLYDAAQTLGAKKRDIFRKVILPASLPNMMTGIRIGIGVGWMTIVAAEMTPVFNEGLGWYIWDRADVFVYDEMFAGMLMIGIIGLVMTKSISYAERWLRR
jgi:NitT/TauT family transport system permease protein